jgi:hypothetical protein
MAFGSRLEIFAMCGAAATPTAGQRSRSHGDADVADVNACQQAGERDPSIVEPVDVARSLCELHSVHIALLQNRSELICTDRRVARAMVGAGATEIVNFLQQPNLASVTG